MYNLRDFLENQINKKVNVFKYENNKLKDNQYLLSLENNTYIIEIINNNIPNDINGFLYLFYQQNLDFYILEKILHNLYKNIQIYRYNKYLIISSKKSLNIDMSLIDIIEVETYKKTYIINLNEIKNKCDFDSKFKLIEELEFFLYKNININKINNINDLIMLKTIKDLENSNISSFIIDNLKNIDENLLTTGIKFIENDLNISKTSEKLFLHRNTLIYRLNKIKELLNLDIKKFKDSFIFYINVKYFLYFKG